MTGLLEAVLPARMGTSFRWLVGSTWISNLGDGMGLAAGPLLVASQTRDPLLVALAGLLQRLPWLVFGLYAGVLADRVDRQRVVVTGDLLRAAVLGAADRDHRDRVVSIAVVLGAMLLLGTAKVFADTATGTLLPMVVAEPGSRHRQRPTHDRLSHRRPARRPGGRRRAVRRGDGVAVPDPVDLRRARSPAGGPDAVAGESAGARARASGSMSSRASG